LAEQIVEFHCLHCGHRFQGPYDPKVPKERSCPVCHSNSVRPMPKKASSE